MLSHRARQGTTATEYALIACLIGAALVVAILNLGDIVTGLYKVMDVISATVK